MAEQPLSKLLDGKTVVVVGPAGYVTGQGKGEWIDSHDIVVRLNWGVPVPEQLRPDLGTRTDVLYKRLLKLGKIDKIDVREYLAGGVKHIVAVDKAASTNNMRHFVATIGSSIPWTLDSSTRRRLRQEMRTSPLIGMIAIKHLLSFHIKSLDLYGLDFYQTGYHEGYGGRSYRESMQRKEGTIARAHDGAIQLRALRQWRALDPRLQFDPFLEQIVDIADYKRQAADVFIIIPARAQSSRFPNKPLAEINGMPMILHVCKRAAGVANPIVATDSKEIADVVTGAGYKAVLTSASALTGTDRVAEATATLHLREDAIVVNVQGDEPLVSPTSIMAMVKAKKQHKQTVLGAFSPLESGLDDSNVVKTALGPLQNGTRRLLYASRSIIPATRDGAPPAAYKQIGLYAYTVAELRRFTGTRQRLEFERSEDIEILRFLELGMPVSMVEVEPSQQAVDLPEHIGVIEEILRNA